MAAKWFCKIDEREIGPLLIAQLQRLATKGQLKADTLVRREDSDVWVSATELSELQSLLGDKSSSPPKARKKPVARRLPVAAAAPPGAVSATASPPPAPPPGPPVANGPGIQIDTHANTTSAAGGAPAAHSTTPERASRAMFAGLIGLGCVVVVLLVAIVFLIAGNDESDDEQTADSKQPVTNLAGRDNQEKADAAGASPAKSTPTKQTEDFSTFSDWRKASSRLGVRNSATKELVCVVGIKSVWASDDPGGDAVESSPAIAASAESDSTNTPVSDDDVLDLSALGVSKKKKRTDITGRIIEPEPEPQPKVTTDQPQTAAAETKDPSSFRYLFVQVSVKNASEDEPLTYLGWNGDGETTQSKDARLLDQDGGKCLFVSHIESPRDDRQEESTIAPQETLLDVLVFELPADGFEHLRLLLPTEAIGQSKHLGYEIKKSDIAFGPPATSASPPTVAPPAVAPEVAAGGKVPPSKADLEQEIQKLREDLTKPEDDQPDVQQPPPKKRDAKEEFQDLKRLIEAERNQE